MPPQSRSTRRCRQGRRCSSSAWLMGRPHSPSSGAVWAAASLGGRPPGMRCCSLSLRPLRTQAATAAGSPTRWAQLRPSPRCWSKVSSPSSGWVEWGQLSSRRLSEPFTYPSAGAGGPPTWGMKTPLHYPSWNAFFSPRKTPVTVFSATSSHCCIPPLALTSYCQRLCLHEYPSLPRLPDRG